jgi:molecular chaperone DnaK
MQRVIGIDLGTSNSCVAIMEDGTPTVIANRGGYKTTPSMVAMTEKKRRVVGHLAKRQMITNAQHTIHTAKRLIGRGWASPQVKRMCQTVAYKIVEGPHGDVRVTLRGEVYSVPEISAMVLAEMKVIAEDYLGEPVTKAVVTVPAYFTDSQRQSTKDAGAIAGLDVIRIINEPTAAALAYGFGKEADKRIAIYDLGGGTFDISILDIGAGGVFNVIATAGDAFLGGEDFDARIIEALVKGFANENSVDLRADSLALQRIRDAAERTKIELSTVSKVPLDLPFLSATAEGEPLHLRRELTREEFDRLTVGLVERTVSIMERALHDAEIEPSEIDEVVMVGGMTRVPRVQRAVAEFFGRAPCTGVHPDEAVAIGAAIQGALLVDDTGAFGELLLLDVTPHTLGVATLGGGFEGVIAQNTTVPTSSTKMFTTSRDNQTTVKIVVMQGPSERAAENEMLGEFQLEGLRRAPAREVSIAVTFAINADGIAAISAKDVESGLEQSISVAASSGLTKEEVAKMIAAGELHAVARKANEELEGKKQQAETLLLEIDRVVAARRADLGAEAMEEARSVAARALEAIDRQDLGAVTEHCEKLALTVARLKGASPSGRPAP